MDDFLITDTRMEDPVTRADAYLAESERNISACLEALTQAMERGDDLDDCRALLARLQTLGQNLTAAI